MASHYDELDRFYRDIWGEHVHHGLWLRGDETQAQAVRQLTELVAREAAVGKGSRVMDIGCGYGATAQLLAEEFGAEVTGITVSEAQHAIAQARAAAPHTSHSSRQSHPTYILGDWLTNTLPAESFDAAIAIESSEHMDKPGFFAQAWRVLRPGGRLVVTSWLSREAPTAWERRWLLEPICREGRMPHVGAESEYRRLAAEAGLAVERFQDRLTDLIGKLGRQQGDRHGNRRFDPDIHLLSVAFRSQKAVDLGDRGQLVFFSHQ